MRHRPFATTPPKIIAALEVVLAAAFWGLGYVAGKWALTSMGALTVVFLRFSIAAAVGWLWLRLRLRLRLNNSTGAFGAKGTTGVTGTTGKKLASEFSRSRQAGISLGLCLILQTIALQYTSVTRCGFLTGLYVVLVPFLEAVMLRSAIGPRLWAWIIVAFMGMTLLCGLDPSQGWNIGDVCSVGCAFFAAYQIVSIDKVALKIENAFAFNTAQNFWALVPVLPLMIWYWELPHLPTNPKAWIGIGIISIGCTLIGFWLAVRAQKVISATVVSILFLLESIFAAMFGYIFFDETLNTQQSFGAALILLACYNTIVLDRKPYQSA